MKNRPGIYLQGKITPDTQLALAPKIIASPRTHPEIAPFGMYLFGRLKWLEASREVAIFAAESAKANASQELDNDTSTRDVEKFNYRQEILARILFRR